MKTFGNCMLDLIGGVGALLNGVQATEMAPGDDHEVTVRVNGQTRTFNVALGYSTTSAEPRLEITLTEVA